MVFTEMATLAAVGSVKERNKSIPHGAVFSTKAQNRANMLILCKVLCLEKSITR